MKIKYHTTETYTNLEKPIELDVETTEIVLCGGHTITISQDQHGDTNIHTHNGRLIIHPDASNWIRIGVQGI